MSVSKADFEIIAGSYEEYLLGYLFSSNGSELTQSFAAHDHSSSIRTISIAGNYLASGGADDRIFIYDLKTRKQHCMLNHHDATITSLQFSHNNSHLLSSSADGVLAIVRTGNWQLEKLWEKAHKGASIIDVAVHPTGKLALTLGSDCSLRTWNLIKGRQAYVINLNSKSRDPKSLNRIVWANDGIRFILFGGKYTEIWSIDAGGVLDIVEHEQKVSSAIWVSDSKILVGYENGKLALLKNKGDSIKKTIHDAHSDRVKGLAKFENWIVSISSSGEIKVWTKQLQELVKYNSGCRLTCVAIAPIVVKKEIKSNEIDLEEQEMVKTIEKKMVSTVVVEIEDDNLEPKNRVSECTNDDITRKSKNKKLKRKLIQKELGEDECNEDDQNSENNKIKRKTKMERKRKRKEKKNAL